MSLPMLCNMGLSGVAFVGCDDRWFRRQRHCGTIRALDGMLYPLMRGSAMTTARHEPGFYRVERICREYIELRLATSRLWEAATTGAPILRPLLYHFPNDSNTYTPYDQVLPLMAAPIYRPGIEHRAVYLPQGTWYDWWSGDRCEANTSCPRATERMPRPLVQLFPWDQ